MQLIQDVSKFPVLAEGGEGIIYEYKNQLIKIYKPHINMKSKQKKIDMLIKASLPKCIVCPIEPVIDRKGNFVGYLMDKVSGEEFKKLGNKKFVVGNNISTKEILNMLVQIHSALEMLHKQNIFIGDLNDQNILFDKNYNVFIIDCDSWTIGTEKCECAMDSFKDSKLISNDFNADTDCFSFAVLCWKSLTRVHPYGGTMNPDIDMLNRMKQGIHLIDNDKVKIPRTCKTWKNLSPNFIANMKEIFSNKTRVFENYLEDMTKNLKYCDVDKDYYYGKFNKCPICNDTAQVFTKPISQGIQSGLSLIPLLAANMIQVMLDRNSFIDNNGDVVLNSYTKRFKPQFGAKYYCANCKVNGEYTLVEDFADKVIVHSNDNYVFDKRYKSNVVVENNKMYYINSNNTLIEVTITDCGNSMRQISKCGNISYFEVKDGNVCIVNKYNGYMIVNCNGYNSNIVYDKVISNYGIHYDTKTSKWLIILEDNHNCFDTWIIKNNEIEYETSDIKYKCRLDGVCIDNSTIFIPIQNKIRGFAFSKNSFKDFDCSVVDFDTKLIKSGGKFIIVNNENVYTLGKQ